MTAHNHQDTATLFVFQCGHIDADIIYDKLFQSQKEGTINNAKDVKDILLKYMSNFPSYYELTFN